MLPICRSWKWLPEFMRSLAPYDRMICSNPKCCCHKDERKSEISEKSEKVESENSEEDLEKRVIETEPHSCDIAEISAL